MAEFNKEVQSVSVDTVVTTLGVVTASSENLIFYKVNVDDVDPNTHVLAGLHIPLSSQHINDFTTEYINGGYSDTAFRDAYNPNGDYVIFNIENEYLGSIIDGKTVKMGIPLDAAATGTTSGLSTTTLYSTFLYSPDSESLSRGSGNWKESNYDKLCSDPTMYSTVFGNPMNTDDNGWYSSSIAYLVTDIYPHNGDTATTWSTGHGSTTPFRSGKLTANFIDDGVKTKDNIVGLINLSSGVGCIWNNDIVNSLDFTLGTGSEKTGTTFNVGDAYIEFNQKDIRTVMSITCLLDVNEYKSSLNPTFADGDCSGVHITAISINDFEGRPLVYAIPDVSILKTEKASLPLVVTVAL